jgi:hypothetical protein
MVSYNGKRDTSTNDTSKYREISLECPRSQSSRLLTDVYATNNSHNLKIIRNVWLCLLVRKLVEQQLGILFSRVHDCLLLNWIYPPPSVTRHQFLDLPWVMVTWRHWSIGTIFWIYLALYMLKPTYIFNYSMISLILKHKLNKNLNFISYL